MSKKAAVFGAGIIGLILATIPLLGSDNVPFLKWWLMVLVLGIGFYPLTSVLFSSLEDRGWIFSKVIGIALGGFLTWVLVCCGVTRFSSAAVLAVTAVAIALCWIFYAFARKRGKKAPGKDLNLDLILGEELIFLAFFLLWTYFAGFRPEAKGTEKFMDYGFMAAMMRSDTLPAKDIWYGTANMNYYYGGQYYAVYLTKLSFTRIQETYNLMRTLVAGFAFVLPFSITYHLVRWMPGKAAAAAGNGFETSDGRAGLEAEGIADAGSGAEDAEKGDAGENIRNVPEKKKDRRCGGKRRGWAAVLGGLLAGTAVSLAGNMHYVLYGLFGGVFKLSGYEDYWFPDSTRYIGHNPLTDDQCIHEFPSYSFVLGDLHAHVVNILFVLAAAGLLLAWMKKVWGEEAPAEFSLKKILLEPQILALGVFIGIFHWTNYWDFVIYYTVVLICIVFASMYRYAGSRKAVLGTAVLQAAEVFILGTLAALPFTSSFQTMVSGVALAQNHSAPYQLLILWGLPAAVVVILLLCVIIRYRRDYAGPGRFRLFFRRAGLADQFALILGICAIGLVLIPELVYVRDIYENGYARSNTMFKLTYQAFILFGMAMSYGIVRLLAWKKEKILKAVGAAALCLVLLTCGYFGYAVQCWFGNVWDTSEYRCLDATAYLENVYPEDAAAIRWLNENVEGNPVVLEANGDSYSDYCRVSAMTGLPTVLGWYVHEWLWRNDTADLNQRAADVETIYTSADAELVRSLLEEYDVEYIFVGSCEREKYPNLNEELLQSLGEVVFSGESAGGLAAAYIIQVE